MIEADNFAINEKIEFCLNYFIRFSRYEFVKNLFVPIIIGFFHQSEDMSQIVLALNILSESLEYIDTNLIENFLSVEIFYINDNDNNFLKEISKKVMKKMFSICSKKFV